MANSISSPSWYQVGNGDLQYNTGTGTLTIHWHELDDDSVWRLTFTPFQEKLGEFATLQDALDAANDFVGDS